jgi:hypothetical protein
VRTVTRALGVVVVAWAGACSPGAPQGRVDQLARRPVDPAAFQAQVPRVSSEERRPLEVFDRAAAPCSYRTPFLEPPSPRELHITRPYDRAAYPPNTTAPTVEWHDELNDHWLLTLQATSWSAPLRVVTDKTSWRLDDATWAALVGTPPDTWTEIEVRGIRVEGGRRVGDDVWADRVQVRLSRWGVDPLLVYRLVSPLFHGLKTPDIWYRDTAEDRPRMFLPGKGTFCTNCHSFPPNPNLPAQDIKLAIAVRDQVDPGTSRRILGIYDFQEKKGTTLNINSFFMSWDPAGKRVAVTGGESVAVRPLVTLETQEFYVVVADINIVDVATQVSHPLPGASEPGLMESFPSWSPDGKTIVFARAEEMGYYFGEKRFSLYQVPYNDGKGGVPVPVPGASENGRSNFAPRHSPDGKWIVFSQADYASLVTPTADLWILSTEPGAMPRKLECNTPWAMDSHHTWSANSRWLAFTTKRDDGIFARIYLTEIDEEGHCSPPVILPEQNETMMCYNVPEFLKDRLDIDPDSILVETSRLKKK